MKKQLLLTLIALILSNCAVFKPHKMDIQQGNVFTDAEVKKLHKGMSMTQVKKILGPPVMQHAFNTNRTDYVYTNQPGHLPMTLKRVTLHTRNNTVTSIEIIKNTTAR